MTDASVIRQRYSLLEQADRYIQLKKRGSDHIGLCPFHEDTNPSLHIFTGRDGVERFMCFACQANGDVIDFIMDIEGVDYQAAIRRLEGGELPPVGTHKPKKPKKSMEPLWSPIIPVPDHAPEYDPSKTYNPKAGAMRYYRPTRIDPYHDAEGRLMFYVVRLDFSDGKITPMVTWCEGPNGEKAWAAKYISPPYPLCGLDQLAKRPHDDVLVVSGEKCYQYALKHLPTIVPVTWPGGDDALERVDISPLKGRYLTMWADADCSSADAMMGLFNRLQRL